MKKYLLPPSLFHSSKQAAIVPVVSQAEKENILSTTVPSATINASRKSDAPSNADATISGERNLERNLEIQLMAAISDHDDESVAKESGSSATSNLKNGASLIRNGKTYFPRMYDVWLYGITTVIGGQYYGWNAALKAGFGSYCIAQIFVGFAYVNLTFCLAEIISTTSFSGGAYGMARIVLGFYAGFIVASFELMEYITYISFSAIYIGEFVCEILGFGSDYVILVCFIFHAITLLFVLEEDKWFWRLNYMLGWTVLIILLIYCIGGLGFVNFAKNATLEVDTHNKDNVNNWFAGGMVAFMQALPYTTWGFGGVESGALITDMIDNPRVNLSYGMAASVCTLFFCMIFIMFVACSLPPGLNKFINEDFFMNDGWNKLGISDIDGEWLIIPAQIAMAFGFFLPATKLLFAMAQSNLIPHFVGLKLHHNHQQVQDHRLAAVYVTLLSFLLCILGIYVPNLDLANIPILLGQFTYLSDLYAFYRMRVDFTTRDFKFRNPFGVVGAAFSACMFILTAISAIGFTGEYFTVGFVGIYFILLSGLYYAFARKHQSFSDDEQKSLLVLHVIKNNQRRRMQKATVAKKVAHYNNNTTTKSQNYSVSQWSKLSKSSKSLAVVSRLAGVTSSNNNINTGNNENSSVNDGGKNVDSSCAGNNDDVGKEIFDQNLFHSDNNDDVDELSLPVQKKIIVKSTSIIHAIPENGMDMLAMDCLQKISSQDEVLENMLAPIEDSHSRSFATRPQQSGKLMNIQSSSSELEQGYHESVAPIETTVSMEERESIAPTIANNLILFPSTLTISSSTIAEENLTLQ